MQPISPEALRIVLLAAGEGIESMRSEADWVAAQGRLDDALEIDAAVTRATRAVQRVTAALTD